MWDFYAALSFAATDARRQVVWNYGSCLHTPLDVQEPDTVPNKYESKVNVLATAKFALVFENSIRPDYATEKLFQAVVAGALPVVWGAPEAALFLPGGSASYVNALEFATPQALADYLVWLDGNHTRYLEYFAWRAKLPKVSNADFLALQHFDFEANGADSFICKTCQQFLKLHCGHQLL